MSNTSPPEPVDVDPNDLRSGKFQLNPGAQQARRERSARGWLVIVLSFIAGYTAGRLVRWGFHVPHPTNLIGVVAYIVAGLMLFGAFSALYRLIFRRSASDMTMNCVGVFLGGFVVEVTG